MSPDGLAQQVKEALHERFAASPGGEPALAEAVSAAWTDLAADEANADAVEDALVVEAQRIRGRTRRDPLGLVITPTKVADALVDLMAWRFPDAIVGAKAVLDPAAGTGRLLRAAARRVGAQVEGWDIDPVALGLAAHRDPEAALHAQDGLVARRPAKHAPGSLMVVCNPPYVAAYARRSQAASLDVERLQNVSRGWTRRAQNLAIAFVARVVRDLLAPGEIAGFIVPDALLNAARYAPLRRAWLAACDTFVVGQLSDDAFDGRIVRPVLIVCRKATTPVLVSDEDVTARAVDELEFVHGLQPDSWETPEGVRRVPSDVVELTASAVIAWPSPMAETAHALIRGGAPKLGDSFTVHDGINPGPADARRALVHDSPHHMIAPRPLVEGRNIHPAAVDRPRLWVETAPEKIRRSWRKAGTSLRKSGIFAGPRLYSRQTARTLEVALVDDDTMATNSVHVIRTEGSRSRQRRRLIELCAFLNTPVATELYQALFAEDREVFPQVKIMHLRALPLPFPLTEDEVEWAIAFVGDGHAEELVRLDASIRKRLLAGGT